MQTPDNRLRFPAPRINFQEDVGLTGQEHDNYPAPQSQARFDHMRMAIIALLSQQSSFLPPTQFRPGSPWFDLNTLSLKIYKDNSWVPYAEVIALTESDENGQVLNLMDWYNTVNSVITNLSPEIVFSGQCTADNISTINLPQSIIPNLSQDSRIYMYINGSLVDPHNCSLIGTPPTSIRLSGVLLSNGDNFTVSIRKITSATFLTTSVVVP